MQYCAAISAKLSFRTTWYKNQYELTELSCHEDVTREDKKLGNSWNWKCILYGQRRVPSDAVVAFHDFGAINKCFRWRHWGGVGPPRVTPSRGWHPYFAVVSRLVSLSAAFRDTLTVVVSENWLCHSGHVNCFGCLLTYPNEICGRIHNENWTNEFGRRRGWERWRDDSCRLLTGRWLKKFVSFFGGKNWVTPWFCRTGWHQP